MKILYVTQRPSDFRELKRCAYRLKNFSCQANFFYVVSDENDIPVIRREVNWLIQEGVDVDSLIFCDAGMQSKSSRTIVYTRTENDCNHKLVESKTESPIGKVNRAKKKHVLPITKTLYKYCKIREINVSSIKISKMVLRNHRTHKSKRQYKNSPEKSTFLNIESKNKHTRLLQCLVDNLKMTLPKRWFTRLKKMNRKRIRRTKNWLHDARVQSNDSINIGDKIDVKQINHFFQIKIAILVRRAANLFIEINAGLMVIRLYFDNLRLFKSMLLKEKPDVIVLPEDIVGAVTPVMIKAGHKCSIPSLVLPYTIANHEEAFHSLKGYEGYQCKRWPNVIMSFVSPRWRLTMEKHTLVRLPAPYILAHLLTRTNPKKPWMMNSGFANIIAVENKKMIEYNITGGVSNKKMKIVGAFYDDDLAERLLHKKKYRHELYIRSNVVQDKPMLLIAGCPDQFTVKIPYSEFTDMNEIEAFLAATLAPLHEKYHIFSCAHPNYTQFGRILSRHGVKIVTEDTARIVPLCDIYLAFASATIRWALSCGVPVINYDVFHYQYHDYSDEPGVLEVRKKADFQEIIYNIPNDEFMTTWRERASTMKESWGILDGKASERIYMLMQNLSSSKKTHRVNG